MDQPVKPPKKAGRPRLKEPHVRICGFVPEAFARELAGEAGYRGCTIGDLIVEAFRNRTGKTWRD